jgi:hypothetical protein
MVYYKKTTNNMLKLKEFWWPIKKLDESLYLDKANLFGEPFEYFHTPLRNYS